MTTQTDPAAPDEVPGPRAQTLAAGRHRAKAAHGGGRDLAGTRRAVTLRAVGVTVLVGAPALVLRVWALDALGLNSDEAVYAGQGASLARDPDFLPYFPVFRAHPLLFQSLLSLEYRVVGVSPIGGRLLSVAFGMATVWLTYAIGARLYGRRAGILAALLIGVMPYTVIVHRQVLLDGPMVFFTSLALYLLIRYIQSEHPGWLYTSAVALGLAVLTKETAILLVGGAFAFFAVTRKTQLPWRRAALALVVLLLTVLPYPISLRLAGSSSTGGAFLVWQLLRRPNHSWWFYFEVVPSALGMGVVAVVVLGLLLMRRSLTWSEHLLVSWIAAPVLFFEIWAVKGYQYLLPIAVPVAVLAAMVVVSLPLPRVRWRGRVLDAGQTAVRATVALVLVLSLATTSWASVQPGSAGASFLAGTGGVPGGREAGEWIDANLPEGAKMLALGPSMANIIQFYGQRKVYGLSVSPNPLNRNPVYDPVHNPDLQIRHSDLQYIVWDSFSAARSSFFSDRLLFYAERYHGRIVHQQFVPVETNEGPLRKPVIIIYEVRP